MSGFSVSDRDGFNLEKGNSCLEVGEPSALVVVFFSNWTYIVTGCLYGQDKEIPS